MRLTAVEIVLSGLDEGGEAMRAGSKSSGIVPIELVEGSILDSEVSSTGSGNTMGLSFI